MVKINKFTIYYAIVEGCWLARSLVRSLSMRVAACGVGGDGSGPHDDRHSHRVPQILVELVLGVEVFARHVSGPDVHEGSPAMAVQRIETRGEDSFSTSTPTPIPTGETAA